MKKIMKSKKGITLISLVVTIIILLILAGISIGMLSGDNSIIGQAGNAKTQTNIAEEKEILQIASLAAISKEKFGDLTKDKLDDELNKYSEVESTEQTDKGIVVTFKSNRAYLINSDGDVSSYYDITIGNLVVKDGNTVLTENCKSIQLGKGLTINFEASITEGSITSISPTLPYTTNGTETSKTFTIIGTGGITKEYTINLKGYYNIPDLKVGDFVKYELSAIDNSKVTTLNSDVNTYSGESNTQTISRTGTITENGKEYLLCRVLEMDSNGNPTKIISADGVNSLSLYGANGYNNAVYLINEMCKTLYSGNQGTTTSLTIEDLENNYFNPTALTTAKGDHYGKKFRYTNSSYTYYPLLAKKEKGIGIATDIEEITEGEGESVTTKRYNKVNATGLGLSQQERSDLENGGSAKSSSINSNGMTVTMTFYSFGRGDNNYKNATLNNIIHYSPTTSSNTAGVKTYWLASRCIEANSTYCLFNMRIVTNGEVYDSRLMFYSYASSNGYIHAIRPVITLNSGIQAWYSAKYNNTYNLWNLN